HTDNHLGIPRFKFSAGCFSSRDLELAQERIIGAVDFRDLPGSVAEEHAGRAVCRVCQLGVDGTHRGFGTGFLIAPGLMMTNHHVFENASDTQNCGAQFGYERKQGALNTGETFEFDAARFFVSDKDLDYAIVAVKSTSLDGTSLSRWGHQKLIGETGKILIGHPISIIQHPNGGPKKYASTNNLVVDRLPDFLHYTTDTEPGSSGSPCYNNVWEVVVLHHAGVPEIINGRVMNRIGQPWNRAQGDDMINWIANEGVRVSRILSHLASQSLTEPCLFPKSRGIWGEARWKSKRSFSPPVKASKTSSTRSTSTTNCSTTW
ncbi:serine protease, partial [Ruegeria sp. HKCCD8929]|uniref:trypsin-like serine peptidase n=1 Tax=Ruegeria sp. HKCCD8929 TaxID=2683006 RepID=UPI001C2C4AEC